MKLIINADDFGASSIVNNAIYNAAKNKFITSTTMLAVGNEVDEAIKMARELNISIGIHLALTDTFRSLSTGEVLEHITWNYRGLNLFKLPKIIKEFQMQIEKLIQNEIQITHIDTHHHIHRYPLVLLSVIFVAKKYNITKIRTQVILVNPKKINNIYRQITSLILSIFNIRHVSAYSDFTHFFKYTKEKKLGEKIVEIMCHPGSSYNDEDYFTENYFKDIKTDLISYDEL